MRVGIALPSTIPGSPGSLILDWARHADAGPFASLAVQDRLVYANYEPLITLAAAAAVTTRVRLLTSVLLAPLRNPAFLAPSRFPHAGARSGGKWDAAGRAPRFKGRLFQLCHAAQVLCNALVLGSTKPVTLRRCHSDQRGRLHNASREVILVDNAGVGGSTT